MVFWEMGYDTAMGHAASRCFGLGLAVAAIWLQCGASVAAQGVTVATDGPGGNFQGYFVNSLGTSSSTPPPFTTNADFARAVLTRPMISARTVGCSTDSFWAQSSTFGGCCRVGGNCNFPTACSGGMLTNRLGGTATCGDRRCYTMTIYADFPTATDSWLVHNCAYTWTASTLWRAQPTETATAAEPSGTTPPAAAETDATADATDANMEAKPASKAWVAGVVLGCVAVAGVLGALGFWLVRRRRRRLAGERDVRGEGSGSGAVASADADTGPRRSSGVGSAECRGQYRYHMLSDDQAGSVVVAKHGADAHAVEMEAGRSHVELEAGPVPGRLRS